MLAHLQMKGHKEDICSEDQLVVTTLQICTRQTEVDTCDRYILISTFLVQNQMCSQQHGSQMSSASPLSVEILRNPGWKRHSDSPLEVHTSQESQTRRGFCYALSNNRCEESCMPPLLVPKAPHSSTSPT